MANFFKEYHAELAEKRAAEEAAKAAPPKVYSAGEKVKMRKEYGSGRKFFADYLCEGYVLLADTKRDALAGYGYVYGIWAIAE